MVPVAPLVLPEIQRHLHTQRRGSGHETAEVRERAEFGVDCAVAALRRTDRVGTPRGARLGDRVVVPALAIDPADRVDRNEIDDIKAEPRNLGEARDAIVKTGARAALGPLAAREHFVPCREAGRLAVDDHFELARITHDIAAH